MNPSTDPKSPATLTGVATALARYREATTPSENAILVMLRTDGPTSKNAITKEERLALADWSAAAGHARVFFEVVLSDLEHRGEEAWRLITHAMRSRPNVWLSAQPTSLDWLSQLHHHRPEWAAELLKSSPCPCALDELFMNACGTPAKPQRHALLMKLLQTALEAPIEFLHEPHPALPSHSRVNVWTWLLLALPLREESLPVLADLLQKGADANVQLPVKGGAMSLGSLVLMTANPQTNIPFPETWSRLPKHPLEGYREDAYRSFTLNDDERNLLGNDKEALKDFDEQHAFSTTWMATAWAMLVDAGMRPEDLVEPGEWEVPGLGLMARLSHPQGWSQKAFREHVTEIMDMGVRFDHLTVHNQGWTDLFLKKAGLWKNFSFLPHHRWGEAIWDDRGEHHPIACLLKDPACAALLFQEDDRLTVDLLEHVMETSLVEWKHQGPFTPVAQKVQDALPNLSSSHRSQIALAVALAYSEMTESFLKRSNVVYTHSVTESEALFVSHLKEQKLPAIFLEHVCLVSLPARLELAKALTPFRLLAHDAPLSEAAYVQNALNAAGVTVETEDVFKGNINRHRSQALRLKSDLKNDVPLTSDQKSAVQAILAPLVAMLKSIPARPTPKVEPSHLDALEVERLAHPDDDRPLIVLFQPKDVANFSTWAKDREIETPLFKTWRDRLNGTSKDGTFKSVRRLAFAKPALAAMEAMRRSFPHFEDVVQQITDHLHLACVGNQAFSLPPLLMTGPPGTGKTFFFQELAHLVLTPYHIVNMESVNGGFVLTGLDAGWANTAPGCVFEALLAPGATANPIFLLDEIDKASGDSRYPVTNALLPLLESHSAAQFKDNSIGIPLDASYINWVATANTLNTVSAPILSRFNVVHVANPNYEARQAMSLHVYRALKANHGWGTFFQDELPAETLQMLAKPMGAVRDLRKSLTRGFASAASAGRSRIEPQDLPPTLTIAHRMPWDRPLGEANAVGPQVSP